MYMANIIIWHHNISITTTVISVYISTASPPYKDVKGFTFGVFPYLDQGSMNSTNFQSSDYFLEELINCLVYKMPEISQICDASADVPVILSTTCTR